LKVAVAAIWAHKLRSALTLLGMIVGVTAFVTVVSLIQGFNVYIDEKNRGNRGQVVSVQRFNPFRRFQRHGHDRGGPATATKILSLRIMDT